MDKVRLVLVLLALAVPVVVCAVFTGRSGNGVPQAGFNAPDSCGPRLISKRQGTGSHFFGLSCYDCHSTKVPKGPGCFTIAGSVYDEARARTHANPVVKLFTEPGGKGKLVATLYGDRLGNFYSTQPIDYSEGLYPTLYGTPTAAEPVKHMYRRIFTGDCNRCHGSTVEALGID